jgi:hypothetical protein
MRVVGLAGVEVRLGSGALGFALIRRLRILLAVPPVPVLVELLVECVGRRSWAAIRVLNS